jgi:hypothetical protein
MDIQTVREKLKPKTSRQAATATTGTAAAVTGVVVWVYPAMQAMHIGWPAMNPEAAWAMTVIITALLNVAARIIPMRDDVSPPEIHHEDE